MEMALERDSESLCKVYVFVVGLPQSGNMIVGMSLFLQE